MIKKTIFSFFIVLFLLSCNKKKTKDITISSFEKEVLFASDTIKEKKAILMNVDFSDIQSTWYELNIKGGDTIIDNVPNLVDEAFISPNFYRLTNDSLYTTIFSDLSWSEGIDTLWLQDEKYFIILNNQTLLIKWIDKKKHITEWSLYYDNFKNVFRTYLYIDSVYNTYSIVDYKWDPVGTFPMDD